MTTTKKMNRIDFLFWKIGPIFGRTRSRCVVWPWVLRDEDPPLEADDLPDLPEKDVLPTPPALLDGLCLLDSEGIRLGLLSYSSSYNCHTTILRGEQT